MTREKAIAYGKDYYRDLTTACCEIDEKHKEFVRVAIQALENHDTFMKYAYSQGKQDALSQEPYKGQTMTREEREAAIAYIKCYRKLDEDLHNTSPKDSISYYATDKCLKYWDMAIKALSQINDIKAIINNPMYIQEDVLRYQMICEVVKE